MKKIWWVFLTSVLFFTFGFIGTAGADTYAGSIGGGLFSLPNGGNVGTEFVVNQDVLVTGLGIFDRGLDGLAGAHQIGVFNSTGTLLTEATVLAGLDSPLLGDCRYGDLSNPFLLEAGQHYVVDSQYSGVGIGDIFGTTATISPIFSFVGGRVLTSTSSLAFPLPPFMGDPLQGWYGPNFQYEVVTNPVPEPATMLLLGMGLVGLIGGASRKKKKPPIC